MSVKLLCFVSSQSDMGFLGTMSLASSKVLVPYTNLWFQHRANKDKIQTWNPQFCSLRTRQSLCDNNISDSDTLRKIKAPQALVSTMATTASSAGDIAMSSEEKVYNVVLKQAALINHRQLRPSDVDVVAPGNLSLLKEAYDRCGEICAEYAKTFYLGTLLMTPERRRAIWAIYVWCRRTDELVDGPNASHITPTALDRWEAKLEDLFNGRPFDMLDAALADTVNKFPVDIQPFKDMIDGMRMDLRKSRYKNFDELYLYCYYVAGTVALMSVPVMGIAPESSATTESVYNAALALGIANQLTNILRDVGEDAQRGRIYLPQDELAREGLSDEDIFAGKVTDKWRNFMKKQIKRARMLFDEAEKGVKELNESSRWPVWASLLLYRQILDEIEANDYNNFTKRAYVRKAKKFIALPVAYVRSLIGPTQTRSSNPNPLSRLSK